MAIAFDAASNGTFNNTNNISWSHTCTGSNRMLFVGVTDNGSDGVTGVTYNGVAMTLVAKKTYATNVTTYLFALQAPATGTNTVEVTTANVDYKIGASVSYTGVNQSVTMDASTTNSATGTSPYNTSLASIADNCWHILVYGTNGPTPTSSQTERAAQTDYVRMEDNNSAKTPAGSVTLGCTYAGSGTFGSVMASFAPAATDLAPNVNDTVTITEAVTMMVDDDPNVSEDVTITEAVTVILDLAINVGEDVAVSETIQFETIGFSASDDVTVAETLQMEVDLNISVFDSVAATEALTFDSPVDVPAVSDDVAVTESVTVMVELDPSVNDAVTVTDFSGVTGPVLVAAARDGLIHYRSTEQSQPLMMDEDEIR